ncbi:MAG: polysaccharide biosynthesis protein [Butyricicoccaceae bacterium]
MRNKDLFAKSAAFMLLDIVIILVSMFGALWVRHDFQFSNIDPVFLESLIRYFPINAVCTIVLFCVFRMYNSLWRFASLMEIRNVLLAVMCSTVLQFVGMHLLDWHVPRSYPLLYMVQLSILIISSRLAYRFLPMLAERTAVSDGGTRTMIVGAGQAGKILVDELMRSRQIQRDIACIVDDDPLKMGTFLHGIPIVGPTTKIPELTAKYHVKEIIIAIPSLTAGRRKRLVQLCQNTSCKVKLLPGIYQIINDEVKVSALREVEINDLLGRDPIHLGMEKIVDYVRDKVVLVTGGGGSIGSEICRQIARHSPKTLIIFDIYENNAYDIRNELLKTYPEMDLKVLIGSVRDEHRVDAVFKCFRPELIFHAAAHKHVPLMEDSPNESIKNNVLGTWNVARAADRCDAKKMVLISTDKAVRPTNIMGASKRICELIIQSFAQTSQTEFVAVRFGNVLDSNGSVVPLFRRQIAEGGPVTVTHPDIIRYFMTIPEAVNLVLQCGALAHGGEIFILDMGEPVKIYDLAVNMIKLSGLEPDRDIKIEFTGLRPGEKLYEELLINLDHLKHTENERIFVAQQPKVNERMIQDGVRELIEAAFDESADIREKVQQLVPEYCPQEACACGEKVLAAARK